MLRPSPRSHDRQLITNNGQKRLSQYAIFYVFSLLFSKIAVLNRLSGELTSGNVQGNIRVLTRWLRTLPASDQRILRRFASSLRSHL